MGTVHFQLIINNIVSYEPIRINSILLESKEVSHTNPEFPILIYMLITMSETKDPPPHASIAKGGL